MKLAAGSWWRHLWVRDVLAMVISNGCDETQILFLSEGRNELYSVPYQVVTENYERLL